MPRGKYANHKGRSRNFTSAEELEEERKKKALKKANRKAKGEDEETSSEEEEDRASNKADGSDSDESESDDEGGKSKGVPGLIGIENLDRVQKKAAEKAVFIAMNKCVVEYYQSDLKETEKFQEALQSILRVHLEAGLSELSDDTKLELCYAFYNYALTLYHSKQPRKALRILKPALDIVDQLDDTLYPRVYLLGVTLLCDLNQSKHGQHMMEALKSRIAASKVPPLCAEFGCEVNREKNQLDLNEMIKLTSARLQLLSNKEYCPPLSDNGETSDYCMLRAHYHYLANEFQQAAEELSKRFLNEPYSVDVNGECQDTVVANNMGIIHFTARHFALAIRFLQHALTFDNLATERALNTGALISQSVARRPEILYNLGVAMLYSQRPQDAYECLLVPLNYNHNNPRLWLRVAEACIMVHRDNVKRKISLDVVSSTIGSGMLRKYILKPPNTKYKTETPDSYAIPNPNLEFASLCLRNARTLILVYEDQLRLQESSTDLNDLLEGVPAMPTNCLKPILFCVLANFSYVLLSLGEFTMALKYARELLDHPDLPETFNLLGHLYCAESLVMLNRPPQEALNYFNLVNVPKKTNNNNVEYRLASDSIIAYNMAVTLTLAGQLDKASEALQKCQSMDVIPYAKKLKVYLELQAGNFGVSLGTERL